MTPPATEPKPAERASDHRPRHPHYEHRILTLAAFSALPFIVLTLLLLAGFEPSPAAALAWGLLATVAWLVLLRFLRRSAAFPLRTVSTLLEALREGDFLLRGRGDVAGDALGEVIREVNQLRDTLHDQRVQVQETIALLDKVIESVDLAVFTFDADGRLCQINAAGRRLGSVAEIDSEALKRYSASDLGLEAYLSLDQPALVQREFGGEMGRWEVRHRTYREGGEIHHLLVISDLSRALREEERLAWQRLIRVLGHEINNSLAPIQSISETLLSRLSGQATSPPDPEDLVDGLDLIGNRAAALERFIQGYTLLARLPEPDRRLLNLEELVQRVARFEADARVRCEGPALSVEADPAQLEQLLINLIKNAVESDEGPVTVEVRWSEDDQGVAIEVLDDGPGLPDSDNLFVPFFTTKPGGNGIGLVLCRRIAEAHGGRLDLSNRASGGCRARLRLPRGAAIQSAG